MDYDRCMSLVTRADEILGELRVGMDIDATSAAARRARWVTVRRLGDELVNIGHRLGMEADRAENEEAEGFPPTK